MIRSFKNKGLEKFYYEGDLSRVLPSQVNIMWRILSSLNVMKTLDPLMLPPYQTLYHVGDDPNEWAYTLNSKWCLTFKFNPDNYDVTDIDYYQFRE